MSFPTVLLVYKIIHTIDEWNDLSRFATLKVFNGNSREDFLKSCEDGELDEVMIIYYSNESVRLIGQLDQELLFKLPPSVRYICHHGAGYDSIDIAACTGRSIQVSHTPTAVNKSTADMTLFLILGALRRIHVPCLAIRAGQWRGSTQLGHDPENKLLGILGMGGIGQEVAKRAKAFGMNVQYHNRSQLVPELEQGADYVSFEHLIKTSDILSLNCSLNKATIGIIGKDELAQMKQGVIIVNTARGKLIDEFALVKALESGKVFSAGLDVFEKEPSIDSMLLSSPNVVLTPHIGTATVETQRAMELLVLQNIENALKTEALVTQVPEQIQA
ncbi:BgtA-21350 [Blumeria graminis f. sp. tritici]|uniref:BgtA-21350 n=2 Tax=Blumeria graminis f. sp. tritici TaxID=62690 RepID=A0A9X9MER7_BLUGR|nr:hypothetical protein BGT96224_A21350 [Blumeria graminis f. sp. tritici 96224]VDB83856.1 BgtA-21350 [Blumeria graminis f. sp. tritici]